jgi:hypothetical protein
MTEKSETKAPNIGYLYHYPRLDHPTDNFSLDIYLSSAPTEQHFDVLRSHFFVANQEGEIERLSVTHPWTFDETAQVCAGLVEMEDWKGKKEEAFTFGGRLTIESQDTVTTCMLTSSAPILEISGATPLHALFIEEMEILFAKRKAAYHHHHEYETRLIEADPLKLYCACLEALFQKFEHLPHKDEKYSRFLVDLRMQKHRIEATELVKEPASALNDIL